MGNGIPLIREPTSSDGVTTHPPDYVVIDENFRKLLQIDQVDDTSDYNKPVSHATQLALDALVLSSGSITEYLFTQATALTTWVIPHNLGRRPTVQVFTTGWVQIIAQVVNTDDNNTQILFDSAQAGFAVLI